MAIVANFHRCFACSIFAAGTAILLQATGVSVASGAIVTNTYTTTVGSFGTPDPDGAFYPLGTPATVTVSYDNSVTYIGAPDTVVQTLVNIPGGLTVTVGSDVFTADNYYITFYNAGPIRPSADLDFRTDFGFPPFPVLHNGLPFGGGLPGYLQFTFYGLSNNTPAPIVPGLSFPMPPYVAEGLVRGITYDQSHEYYFQNGTWTQVPTPGAAVVMGLGGLGGLVLRRRR